MTQKRIQVVQPEEEDVPQPILAEAIVQIGKAMKKLRDSGINEAGVVALLKDATGMTKKSIRTILNALNELEKMYCR